MTNRPSRRRTRLRRAFRGRRRGALRRRLPAGAGSCPPIGPDRDGVERIHRNLTACIHARLMPDGWNGLVSVLEIPAKSIAQFTALGTTAELITDPLALGEALTCLARELEAID